MVNVNSNPALQTIGSGGAQNSHQRSKYQNQFARLDDEAKYGLSRRGDSDEGLRPHENGIVVTATTTVVHDSGSENEIPLRNITHRRDMVCTFHKPTYLNIMLGNFESPLCE